MRHLFFLLLATLMVAPLDLRGQTATYTLDSIAVQTAFNGTLGGSVGLARYDNTVFFGINSLISSLYRLDSDGRVRKIADGKLQVVAEVKGGYLVQGTLDGEQQAASFYLEQNGTTLANLFPFSVKALGTSPDGGLLVTGDDQTFWLSTVGSKPVTLLDLSATPLSSPLLNGKVLFFNAGGRLYRTDGSKAGTFVISERPAVPEYGNCVIGKRLAVIVGAGDDTEAYRILITDGSNDGTGETKLSDLTDVPNVSQSGELFATPQGVALSLYSKLAERLVMVTTAGVPNDASEFVRQTVTMVEYDSRPFVTAAALTDGKTLFNVPGGGGGMYVTNGTPSGTVRLFTYDSDLYTDYAVELELVATGPDGTNYALYRGGYSEQKLYAITPASKLTTVPITTPGGNCRQNLSNFLQVGSTLFFGATDDCNRADYVYRLSLNTSTLTSVNGKVDKIIAASEGRVVALYTDLASLSIAVFTPGSTEVKKTRINSDPRVSGQKYLLQKEDITYFLGYDNVKGEAIYRFDFGTGAYDLVSEFDYRREAIVATTGGLLEHRGKHVYFLASGQLYSTTGAGRAEALVKVGQVSLTEAIDNHVVIQGTPTNEYWLTDGSKQNTRPITMPAEINGAAFVTYRGKFYALRASPSTTDPTLTDALQLYTLTAKDTEPRQLQVRLDKPYNISQRKLPTIVAHDDGLLYTLLNLGDETGGALLISTDGTDAATRVVKEVRAGRAGYLATNLRSEAGVLRFEWQKSASMVTDGDHFLFELYEPAANRLIRLFSGPELYATTARVGDEVFVHDTTRIYALSSTDVQPRLVFDYEVATGTRSQARNPFRVSNLTAAGDGTLLYHRGTKAFGVGRLFPDENYREETIFAAALASYDGYDRRQFPIIGDQLFSTFEVNAAAPQYTGPYRYQLYNLNTGESQAIAPGEFTGVSRLSLAVGQTFYFISGRPFQLYNPTLYTLTLADRESTSGGTVFDDHNADGKRQSGEAGLGNIRVSASSALEKVYTFSDSLGHYSFDLIADNDYLIAADSLKCFTATPAGAGQPFVSRGSHTAPLPDLGLRSSGAEGGLLPYLVSSPTRCGFTVPFDLTVTSDDCAPTDGTVTLFLPEGVVGSTDDRSVTWAVPTLRPREVYRKRIELTMPGEARVGDTLNFVAVAENAAGRRDTFIYVSEVRCAIDPNDKLVNPSRADPNRSNYTRFDEALTYTIRFQNTGNDTAFTVRLTDQLSKQVDVSTFQPVGASHPYNLQLTDLGLLTVRFDRILLPDSTTNEKQSHGFFAFSVALLPKFKEGPVNNEASIYFDFNAPIITNRVTSTIVETLDADRDGIYFWQDCDDTNPDPRVSTACKTVSTDDQTGAFNVAVYPNPSSGKVTVALPDDGRYILVLTDPYGRTLYRSGTQQRQSDLDLTALPASIYLLTITEVSNQTSVSVRVSKH